MIEKFLIIIIFLFFSFVFSKEQEKKKEYSKFNYALYITKDNLPPDLDVIQPINTKKRSLENFNFISVENQVIFLEKKKNNFFQQQSTLRLNVLSKPAIIPLGNAQNTWQQQYAYSNIFTTIQKYSSQYIVYPYSINYTDLNPTTGVSTSYYYEDGAMINIKPSKLPPTNYFNYIKGNSNIEFGRAKALFDVNVAVMRIEGITGGTLKDLTYESDFYCNVLATYLGKYPQCLNSFNFLKFYGSSPSIKTAQLVYLNESDISRDNLLFIDADPKLGLGNSKVLQFDVLIIPDIVLNSEDLIAKKLGKDGAQKLLQFVQMGGLIYTSGKSGAVLEKLSDFMSESDRLIPKGSYDTTRVLFSLDNKPSTIGCERNFYVDYGNSEKNYQSWVKSLLCFSPLKTSTNQKLNYLIGSYMMRRYVLDGSSSQNLVPLIYFDPYNLKKTDVSNGFSIELDDADKSFLPLTLYKQIGKGHIIINNANPTFRRDTFPWFFNVLFIAMSKNLILDASVAFEGEEDKPIPGLEAEVVLDMKYHFYNLFDTKLTDFELDFWVPKNVATMNIDFPSTIVGSKCELSNILPPPSDPNNYWNLNISNYWKCSFPEIATFTKTTISIKIEILDATVTQRRYNILMSYPIVFYTDGKTFKRERAEQGGIFVNALIAAVLRGQLNPDPCGFYPIHGKGDYIDNVLPVENKEHTNAHEVEFISNVPIIFPAVDGSDQFYPITLLKFWDKYYTQSVNGVMKYPFPLRNVDDYDYIDFKFLRGKGITLVSHWDEAVKNFKEMRGTNFPAVDSYGNKIIDIHQLNVTTTHTNLDTVLKQLNFKNADIFFEHATQRNLVFVDLLTSEGANSYYGGIIPDTVKNPNRPTTSKVEYVWVRTDVYFYNVSEYAIPVNVKWNDVFSIDKYPSYTGPCAPNFGDARAKIMVPGYFDDNQPDGLKPNEYSNELLMNCQMNKKDYNTFDLGNDIKRTRYLVPIIDNNVQKASDLLDFDEITGLHNIYPEIRFIYGYRSPFLLSPAISRKGGKIEFILPSGIDFNGIDPIKNSLITYISDHVAFTTTQYNSATRTITSFFKRGNMPNEQWGKDSQLTVNFEGLTTTVDNFTIIMNIYEMKYDLSSPSTNYETYYFRESRTQYVLRGRYFSLPSLRISFKLKRGASTDINEYSILRPYELIEPFARFGVYYQELLKHRTVWGSAEAHHISDPGLQAKNSGFAVVSNIGIHSIPFQEYLTTGKSQMIPSAFETSQIVWKDIWNRNWAEPIRTTNPDIPPIPPPIRNFMMSTTFELTKKTTGERVFEWASTDELDIRVHLKLLNNYPKYFQITTCKDNEVNYYTNKPVEGGSRIFGEPPYTNAIDRDTFPKGDFTQDVDIGNQAYYGSCFYDDKITNYEYKVGGQVFTSAAAIALKAAHLCLANNQSSLQCSKDIINIPTVKHWDGVDAPKSGKQWNYSPKTDIYYPDNYVKSNMWDLTHYDYDDNAFDKAYKYHMDNWLPNSDNGIIKPHNIIAQPIWKGFGYQIDYSKSHSLPRYSDFQGWWSDNLQNHDHTLLAAQDISLDYSVYRDLNSSLKDSDWISINQMNNFTTNPRLINRLKNIYVCLFNRNRLKTHPKETTRAFFYENVNQNNIVPVIPDLNSYDSRLTNYKCDFNNVKQYTQKDISQVDNRVYTNSARDWLYFAANLRGNAKETINVPYTLKPFSGVNYEGMAKIQDGGTFTYWNPCCSLNTYLIVNNPVNVIQAKRVDLQLENELFPKFTTTFESTVYHLISIKDPAEIYRRYTDLIWINHYGFGDFSTSVYVGGTKGSKSIINPKETTYAKITLYNNAGFDMEMKGKSIDFEYKGSQAISAMDLLSNFKHAILAPKSYNFLKLNIPTEIQPYITIVPSDHNIDVAPLFFDFQNINVVTIRDGYKGDYFYRITLNETIPNEIRGRLWEIGVELVEDQFFKCPGTITDPIMLLSTSAKNNHDYRIKIPSIVIGIPFSSSQSWAGSVFYFLGTSSNLQYSHVLPTIFQPIKAKFIIPSEINYMRWLCGDKDKAIENLKNFFDTNLKDREEVPFFDDINNLRTIPTSDLEQSGQHSLTATYIRDINFNLTAQFSIFPKRIVGQPHQAEIYILLKTFAPQLPYGEVINIYYPSLSYLDDTTSRNNSIGLSFMPNYRTVSAKGANLQTEYIGVLVDETTLQPLEKQIAYPKESGILRIQIKNVNIGSDICYRSNMELSFTEDTKVWEEKLSKDYKYQIIKNPKNSTLTLFTERDLPPGTPYSEYVYLRYIPLTIYKNATQYNDFSDFPPVRTLSNQLVVSVDLTQLKGEVTTKSILKSNLNINYVLRSRQYATLIGKYFVSDDEHQKKYFNTTGKGPIQIQFEARHSYPEDLPQRERPIALKYIIKRKIISPQSVIDLLDFECKYDYCVISSSNNTSKFIDVPIPYNINGVNITNKDAIKVLYQLQTYGILPTSKTRDLVIVPTNYEFLAISDVWEYNNLNNDSIVGYVILLVVLFSFLIVCCICIPVIFCLIIVLLLLLGGCTSISTLAAGICCCCFGKKVKKKDETETQELKENFLTEDNNCSEVNNLHELLINDSTEEKPELPDRGLRNYEAPNVPIRRYTTLNGPNLPLKNNKKVTIRKI